MQKAKQESTQISTRFVACCSCSTKNFHWGRDTLTLPYFSTTSYLIFIISTLFIHSFHWPKIPLFPCFPKKSLKLTKITKPRTWYYCQFGQQVNVRGVYQSSNMGFTQGFFMWNIIQCEPIHYQYSTSGLATGSSPRCVDNDQSRKASVQINTGTKNDVLLLLVLVPTSDFSTQYSLRFRIVKEVIIYVNILLRF